MQIKEFVSTSIKERPKLFGGDNGDIRLVNAYFEHEDWMSLSKEQYKAIALLIRHRNYFLNKNEVFDNRSNQIIYEHVGQSSIYDFIDSEDSKQFKKIVRYFVEDPNRISFTDSRVKKSIRGSDSQHISAVRILHNLFIANPKIKQRRVKKVKKSETLESTATKSFKGDFYKKLETNNSRGTA